MRLRIPTPRLRRRKADETEVQAAATPEPARPEGTAATPKAAAAKAEAAAARPGAATAKPEAEPGKPGAAAAPGKPGVTPQPSADPHERLDGLRAWLAQVDRKVGVRSYAGGAAVVLALAAGIVGVVLALSAKDESATKDEVRALREQISTIGDEAAAAAEEGVQSLTDQLESLEGRVTQIRSSQRTTQRELSVVQDDIDDLRSEASDAGAGTSTPGGAGSGVGGGAGADIPGIPDVGGGGGGSDNP
ncbi:MAG: hypothetical protein ACRDK9_09975 [Solirubrobacterales bacterium]